MKCLTVSNGGLSIPVYFSIGSQYDARQPLAPENRFQIPVIYFRELFRAEGKFPAGGTVLGRSRRIVRQKFHLQQLFCTPHEFGTRGEILFVGIAGGDHRNPDYEWFAGGFQPFQIVQNLPVVLPGQNPVAFRIGTLQILNCNQKALLAMRHKKSSILLLMVTGNLKKFIKFWKTRGVAATGLKA